MRRADRRDRHSFYTRIKAYDRLMRAGSPLAGGLTIYGNREQLALVAVDGIREYVKYIEFRNLRAVLIQRHSTVLKSLIILLVTAGVMALIFLAGDGFTPAFAAGLIPAAALCGAVILTLRNCSVRIVTDVYDHHLIQVSRYRQARALLEMVIIRMEPYLERAAAPPLADSTAVAEPPSMSAAEEIW